MAHNGLIARERVRVVLLGDRARARCRRRVEVVRRVEAHRPDRPDNGVRLILVVVRRADNMSPMASSVMFMRSASF